MGFSNVKCKNIHKMGCDFYIDRFFCPEKCEGFIPKDGYVVEEEAVDAVAEELTDEYMAINKNKRR